MNRVDNGILIFTEDISAYDGFCRLRFEIEVLVNRTYGRVQPKLQHQQRLLVGGVLEASKLVALVGRDLNPEPRATLRHTPIQEYFEVFKCSNKDPLQRTLVAPHQAPNRQVVRGEADSKCFHARECRCCQER